MCFRIVEQYLLPKKKRSRACVGYGIVEERRGAGKRYIKYRLHATKGWRKESASTWFRFDAQGSVLS